MHCVATVLKQMSTAAPQGRCVKHMSGTCNWGDMCHYVHEARMNANAPTVGNAKRQIRRWQAAMDTVEVDIGEYFAGVDDAFVTVMAMGGHQHNRWTYSEMSILTTPAGSPRMNPAAGGDGPSVWRAAQAE